MSFLNKIKSSIYDPVFYKDVVDGKVAGSFVYYLKLSVSLALFISIAFSIMAVPRMKEFLVTAKGNIEQNYPKDLVVQIKNGTAMSNAVDPFFVAIPQNLKVMDKQVKDFENILVIDTKNDFNLENFRNFKTAVLLTRDSLVVEGGDGRLDITPLKDIPDFTVNHENVTKVLAKSEPLSKVLNVLVPVTIFLGVFIGYMFKMLYLILVAVLVLLIGKLMKLDLSFRKSFSLSLYAVTLPTFVSVLFFFLGMKSPFLVPTMILLVVVLVNLKSSTVESPAL